jgi:predicted acylesterase/phospholipase RssA
MRYQLNMSDQISNIALSLSGGGYRAAAFHLGCMKCLNDEIRHEAPLLSRLAILSSISGGTITAVVYAHTLARGRSFQEFYEAVKDFLHRDELLNRAFGKLNNPDAWKAYPMKQRNLINAFALVYDEMLFNGATLGDLFDARALLPEFAFNATDVDHSALFRFAVNSGKALIGHSKSKVTQEAAREIRLADIVAASSCFPGGFEPMIMPGDFARSEDSLLSKLWTDRHPVRLMDGGILDNQGIESVKLFERRMSNEGVNPYIGTFIISDASRKGIEVPETEVPVKTPFLLHWSLRHYQMISCVLAVLSAVVLSLFESKWIIVPAAMVLTVCLLWLAAGYVLARQFITAIKGIVSEESPDFLKDFGALQKVPLKYVVRELASRLSSIGRLGDVFLSRIRDMNYKSLFGDSYWRERVITNYIYDLLGKSSDSGQSVELANKMETTLWFSPEQKQPDRLMLDALIEAGRVTMKHNLESKKTG